MYSRIGRTDSEFARLHDAGRLDIVYECIVASFFLSHGIRRNVTFHGVLNGPPRPPLHLKVDGAYLHDVRTDQQTWEHILKKMLAGGSHPGITVNKLGFEAVLKDMADRAKVYVLEEKGQNVADLDFSEDAIFVLGDHVGLPIKAESFALRYGQKISLGRQPYLAASCITVLNYLFDSRGKP